MPKPEEPGKSKLAHERRDARKAYKEQWEADHPGEEFPGYPPELEGMGKDDEDEPEVPEEPPAT
jgi:hypothetical protein